MNPTDFWSDFKAQLLTQNSKQALVSSWLEGVRLLDFKKEQNTNTFYFQISSDLHKNWFQENISASFLQNLSKSFHGDFKIHLQISHPELPSQNSSYPKLPYQKNLDSQTFFGSKRPNKGPNFNPSYTFEHFIPGKNSEWAYSACLRLGSSQKASSYSNPLFIYGPSGLGKTHLLHAIGQENLRLFPHKKVRYLSAERFINDFVSALRMQKMPDFRQKFRKNCDLLLMDDIQVLSRGKEVQEEFFNTFNELFQQEKQVVFCCDQEPDSVPNLKERIKTRLSGGLVLEITYPDKETRLAILKNKLEKQKLYLSEKSLNLINRTYKRSVREIEGIVNTIKFMTEMNEGVLSFEEIEKKVGSFKKPVNIKEIQKAVASHFRLEFEDLQSSSRKKNILRARQTAMYLIRKILKKPYQEISLIFGRKDHSTGINAINQVEKRRSKEPDFKRRLELLHKEILNQD